MRVRRFPKIPQRVQRSTKLFDASIGAQAHGLEHFVVLGVFGEIFKFIRIILKIMQKLMVPKIGITHIFKVLITQPLKGRNATAYSVMFVERFERQPAASATFDHGLETATLIAFWNFHARPIQKVAGKSKFNAECIVSLTALFGRHAWITTISGTRSASS